VGDDGAVVRETRLPDIEVHDDPDGFELAAPAEALVRLADAMRDAVRVEVAAEGGSVVVVLTDGPVVLSHVGRRVQVVGGRAGLDRFADTLRFVAAGPQVPSEVAYHLHVEHYEGHPWLASDSEPAVIVLIV
jgi:hypothetical protein